MRVIKLTIGEWIISSWNPFSTHYMYHTDCHDAEPMPHQGPPPFTLVVYCRRVRDGKQCWHCSRCEKETDEGLVGAYLMLETKYAYDLIESGPDER